MKRDWIEGLDNAERRFTKATMELRDEVDDARTLFGIASTVDQRYDMGWYEEEVVRGAFDDVIQDDVVFLFDHEGMPMARTTSDKQKLTLSIDERGNLAYSLPIRSERTDLMNLADAILTGVVYQSSFAFRIAEQEWVERRDEKDLRRITKIERMYDVSAVTFPANPNTSVAKRYFEKETERRAIKNKTLKELEMAMSRRELY